MWVRKVVIVFLVAITIQSRRNVCGTKWSVMGNRLLAAEKNTE